jgi:replicative superfamily II helicase
MMGRAGRKHGLGTTAEVDVIVEESDEEYLAEGMKDDSGMDVLSVLSDLDELCFHILPEISAGRVRDKATAREWFRRSFRALQGGEFDPQEVFDALVELEAAQMGAGRISTTMIGEASAMFYFHPADVAAWKMNFDELFEEGMEYDEVAPAWALGSIPCNRASGDMGKNRWVINDCLNKMPAGFEVMEGSLVNTTLWWHCMGGPPVGKLKNVAMAMRKDFGRIRSLLNYLDHKVACWGMSDYFDELETRVKNGITPELLELCKLNGISKGRAAYLYNMGVTNLEELREQAENLEDEIEEDFMNAIRRLV